MDASQLAFLEEMLNAPSPSGYEKPMQDVVRRFAGEFADVGAQRVGISLDAVEKQKQFSDKHDFDYPLLADTDGTVAKQFGVKRAVGLLKVKRNTFVIGADQRLVAEISSELNMDKHADEALAILRKTPA